jgi:WD40 repeat protein
MDDLKRYAIFLSVIVVFTMGVNSFRKNMQLSVVTSNINNKKYYVRKLPDKQDAADKLGNLTLKLKKLITHVQNDMREGVDRLENRFNSDIITENIPGSKYVAYSVNKGEELSICIRNKETNQFIDDNTVTFVAIHELSHIMSKSTGHTVEFWDNMKYLLEQASDIGIYSPVDYSTNPIVYCGEEINSTPLNI